MNVFTDSAGEAIEAALEKVGGDLTRVAPARWRMTLMNGRPFEIAAASDVAREWLMLDADTGFAPEAPALWRALTLSGVMAGFGKLALRPSGLRLRAELPLARREVLTARVTSTCSAFKDALAALEDGFADHGHTTTTAAEGQCDLSALAAGCQDAGWDVAERANGRFVVRLDSGHRFFQALVEPRLGDGALVSAELLRLHAGPSSQSSRLALATLLLTIAGLVRLARATASASADRIVIRLEVAFDAAPDVTDLTHALSALSIGCHLAGDEARALQDEQVAGRYLAIRNHADKGEGR